ncbi:P-loop containing nucleoside triphosphate hydrolase protein [Naviculisporaceae sp. PSN 640]
MESLLELHLLSDCTAVVVMGATGSGKSTFISLLADEEVEVSHGLESHTTHGRAYSFEDPDSGEQMTLMDMPGFDDTSRSDAEILRELSYSLVMLHRTNVRLAGVVYLHRISDPRMSGSAIKSLRLFKALCGAQNYPHIVLATTMWTDIDEERVAGQQREQDLSNTYWADLITGGSQVVQHDGSRESALSIVRGLTMTERSKSVTLAIQRELVVEGRTLDDTEVGRILSQEMESDRARAVRDAQDLDSSLKEAEQDGDGDTAAALRAERQAAQAKAARRTREKEALRISLRQLREEQHSLDSRRDREGKQRKKQRAYYTSYSRVASPSQDSDSEAAGTVEREGRVVAIKHRRSSLVINERSSSLGKTTQRRVVRFMKYTTT